MCTVEWQEPQVAQRLEVAKVMALWWLCYELAAVDMGSTEFVASKELSLSLPLTSWLVAL